MFDSVDQSSSPLVVLPSADKIRQHPPFDMTPTSIGPSRPWTASRPTTARPMTSASTKYEGTYVIALLEGRGVAREIGMAALDKDTGKVMLVQVRLYILALYTDLNLRGSSQTVRPT